MIISIPTTEHLGRLYYELQEIGGDCVGSKEDWPYDIKNREGLICLACDMSRYDPRLMTILVRYLDTHWNDLNPSAIRGYYNEMQTPQTIAVLCEFVLSSGDVKDEKKYFFEYLQRGLQSVSTQFYFHHLYSPGGTLANRAASSSLKEYKRWGFLACEAPVVDADRRLSLGTMDVATRKNILYDLLKVKKRIHISDYLKAVKNSISRQQALNDLKGVKWAKRRGRGRGAYWHFAA